MYWKYKAVDNPEYIGDIIKNNRLYFPKAYELNDPLEGINNLEFGACGDHYHLNEGETDTLWNPYKSALDKYRILSLSKSNDNVLMWSHYANNFSGVCIGFDENKSFAMAEDVVYSPELYQVDQFRSLEEIAHNTLIFKNKDWVYEKEKRIILMEKEQFFYFDKDEIKEIILGPKINEFSKEIICLLVEKYNPQIRMRQAKIDFYHYKMNINDIA